MSGRKYNFDEEGPSDQKKAEEALRKKKDKLTRDLEASIASEKRWLSKLKRATTAVNKNRSKIKRLQKALSSLK